MTAPRRDRSLKPPADGALGTDTRTGFDALLLVAFGGPEGMDDVMPFLETVTKGRNVPRERLEAVAEHYALFDGVSPINAQNRALISGAPSRVARARDRPADLRRQPQLAPVPRRHDPRHGSRRRRASARVLHHRIQQLLELPAVPGEHPRGADGARRRGAGDLDSLRAFYNHPGFVEAGAELLRAALERIPASRRARAHVAFTAHSIPLAMARGCRYEAQLAEAARLVADGAAHLSTPSSTRAAAARRARPWLEPDVCDHLRGLAERGVEDVVLSPLGFVSDHIEVLYDLDVEASRLASELGLELVRAPRGRHPPGVRRRYP